jgi:hypothetical protein
VGFFAGPALGGLLLAVSSIEVVFFATAGTFLWSALFLSQLPAEAPRERGAAEPERLAQEAIAGLRTIAGQGRLRVLVGLFGAQTLVAGAFQVLVAVAALELLHLGSAGVGYLNSAVGVGGIVGGFVAMTIVARRRLATVFGLGLVVWGVPILLVGVWPSLGPTLVFLASVGVAVTVVDVSGFTLLQRSVPDEVLARVFGVLYSVFLATFAIGAILAPVLINGVGVRGALITTGALLPALAALSRQRLSAIDREAAVPQREVELLRTIPIFAPLPPPTLEVLASSLVTVPVTAHAEVFRQGDRGDRFYIVKSGEVEITVDERPPAVFGPGSYFGEIALLRDVPRTATVTARSDGELYALERDQFIAVVTGHAESARAAEAVVGARLGAFRPGMGSI